MDASFDGAAGADRSVADAFVRQRTRLRSFIRRRVPDPADVEDILQDVFSELVEAARLVRPIEEVGAWLFRVARNRIIDRFRRNKRAGLDSPLAVADVDALEDLLPAEDGGP